VTRRGRLGLLLTALLAPASLRGQTASDSAGLEPVIVELAIGRFGTRTVSAYRSSGDALLPVIDLAQLVELRTLLLADGAVELTLEPGRRQVTLDPSRWEINTGDGPALELTPADRVVQPGEQYLSTRICWTPIACRSAAGSRGSAPTPCSMDRMAAASPTSPWRWNGPAGTGWCSTIRSWRRARICSATAPIRRGSA
jgi:hypothetical protein